MPEQTTEDCQQKDRASVEDSKYIHRFLTSNKSWKAAFFFQTVKPQFLFCFHAPERQAKIKTEALQAKCHLIEDLQILILM